MKGEAIKRTTILPRNIHYIIAIILIVVAVLATLNIGGSTQSVLSKMHIWPKPEGVSELFFTKPTALPTTFTPNSKTEIDFTVRNLELRDVTYDYKIEQLNPANEQTAVLNTGALSLSHSKEVQKRISVTPTDIRGESKISITVTYPSDSNNQKTERLYISYWLKNSKEF